MVITPQLQPYIDTIYKSFESPVPWLYLDSEGKVTIGAGHNVSAHKDSATLGLVVKRHTRKAVKDGDVGKPVDPKRAIDSVATSAEIENDLQFFKDHPGLKKYLSTQLQLYTTLEIPPDRMKKLFDADIQSAISTAQTAFGDAFNSYPVGCQAALIDIAFNAGGFKSFQGTFVPAIKGTGIWEKKTSAERWTAAAEASRRGSVTKERNDKIKKWLLEGANAK